MIDAIAVTATFFMTAFICIFMGLPMALGKIPYKSILGIRLKKTLASEEVWHKANKFGGKSLLISGLIILFYSVLVLLFRVNFSPRVVVLIGLIGTLLVLTLSLVSILNYIKRL